MNKILISTFMLFLLHSHQTLQAQCGNFTNSIIVPAPGTINQCNDTPPSSSATICADFNVIFSNGNASFYWGYVITNNGVPNTITNGPINTSQPGSYPNIVCVNVACGASITFFINSYSNPNGGGSLCNGANATISTIPFNPLPIVLKSFNVSKSGNVNELFWQTASETNNDYFTIERSGDGRTFDAIGEIKGAGNSTEEKHYEFTDENPLPGINYYRIKQTDFDGQYSYSEIRSVRHTGKGNVAISPRSTDGRLDISTDMESYDVALYSSAGQEVARFNALAGHQTVNIEALQAGVYFVKVMSGTESETVRVIKY